jgi:hypothetical protein
MPGYASPPTVMVFSRGSQPQERKTDRGVDNPLVVLAPDADAHAAPDGHMTNVTYRPIDDRSQCLSHRCGWLMRRAGQSVVATRSHGTSEITDWRNGM